MKSKHIKDAVKGLRRTGGRRKTGMMHQSLLDAVQSLKQSGHERTSRIGDSRIEANLFLDDDIQFTAKQSPKTPRPESSKIQKKKTVPISDKIVESEHRLGNRKIRETKNENN